MLSYQSLMPAGAGTPRYEKPELWFGAANWHGGFCHGATPTPAGDKPPRYIFSFRHRIGLRFGTFRPWRAGIKVD